MATTEVTIAQYCEFLNAVAADDTNALWTGEMESDLMVAGIRRSGPPGSYRYSLIGSGARPITYPNWYAAARFINWLHNGQPTGPQGPSTSESGVYTLTGPTSGSSTRALDARFFLPTASEQYKAAYHAPRTTAMGGPPGDTFYWLYPTQTQLTLYSVVPPGVLCPDVTLAANIFKNDGIPNDFDNGLALTNLLTTDPTLNHLSDVGAYTRAKSYWGLSDAAGNVQEWTETILSGDVSVMRGGGFSTALGGLQSTNVFTIARSDRSSALGFRVARPMPVSSPCADLTGDHIISSADLAVLLTQFGASCP